MLTSFATRLISLLNPIMRLCVVLGIGFFLLDKTVGVSYLLDQALDHPVPDAKRGDLIGRSSLTPSPETNQTTSAMTVESIQRDWARRQTAIRDAGARTAGTAIGICGCVWLASCAVVPVFMVLRRLS